MDQRDTDAVQAVLMGDVNAFAPLVTRYQSSILRLCQARLKSLARAEEATQEVFLKAFRSLESYRSTASFKTWIYRIAMNHCIDLIRREKLESLLFWKKKNEQDPISQRERPVDLTDAVTEGMNHLSGEEREILTLREIEGLSYDELSQTLQISLEAVKSRLRRARQALLSEVTLLSKKKEKVVA